MKRQKRIVCIGLLWALCACLSGCFAARGGGEKTPSVSVYTVALETEGGIISEPFSREQAAGAIVELPQPYKDGYRFAGWFATRDFFGEPLLAVTVTGNITLYAKYDTVYTVTYYTDGGTHSNRASVAATDRILLADAKKAGFVFAGWYAEATFDTRITELAGVSQNTALYARFLPAYRITYHLDGGINSSDNPSAFGKESEIVFADPEKAGHAFVGWYDASGNRVTGIRYGTQWDTEVFARWEAQTYKIEWDLSGGSVSQRLPQSYVYGTGVPAQSFAIPQKDGMLFLGWYTERNGGTELVTSLSEQDYGDRKFTAKWYGEATKQLGKMWAESKTSSGTAEDIAVSEEGMTLQIPSELKELANAGLLQIRVEASFSVSVRSYGNATGKAVAYLLLNGSASDAVSVSAKGGGYSYWDGFWTNPVKGDWRTETQSVALSLCLADDKAIGIGYRYYMESNKTNDSVKTDVRYECESLCYTFSRIDRDGDRSGDAK